MNVMALSIPFAVLLFSMSTGIAFADHSHESEEASHSHATTVLSHEEDDDLVHLQTKVSQLKTVLESLVVIAKQRGMHVDLPVSANPAEDHAHAHTEMYELDEAYPSVELSIHEGKGGYAVHADTERFTFAPLHADGEHVDGEGHAHIYVDGVKISRMYAPWFYLAAPKGSGEHVIRVELSTNDHRVYAHDGKAIEASKTIVVD